MARLRSLMLPSTLGCRAMHMLFACDAFATPRGLPR